MTKLNFIFLGFVIYTASSDIFNAFWFVLIIIYLLSVSIIEFIQFVLSKNRIKYSDDKAREIIHNPKILIPSLYEEKIRRNLITFSILSISLVFLKPELQHPTFFGITFTGFNDKLLYWFLLAALLYTGVNYFWNMLNSLALWRVSLTGNPVYNEFTGELDRYEENLYSLRCNSGGKNQLSTKLFDGFIKDLKELIESLNNEEKERLSHDSEFNIYNKLENLRSDLEQVKKEDVLGALFRFESWFDFLTKSQAYRWLFVDIVVPIVLFLSGVGTILYRINSI